MIITFRASFRPIFAPIMNNTSRFSYPAQLALLLMLTGVSLMLGTLITLGVAAVIYKVSFTAISVAITAGNNVGLMRFVQALSSVLGLGLPCFLFAWIINKKPFAQLGFSTHVSGRQIMLVLLIAASCLLAGNLFSRINEAIPLSSRLAAYFKALELNYATQMLAIANMQNVTDYIVSLLIIALLPAIIEELFFRGCMQQVLVNWTRKPFVGILITSIIFSASHMSFFGFLPRLFLGMILGYIFFYSKNIWLNILAHFFNNACALTMIYYTSLDKKITVEMMMKEDAVPYYLSIGALVVVVWLMVRLKRGDAVMES